MHRITGLINIATINKSNNKNAAAVAKANKNTDTFENKLELNWSSINAIRMGHNYSKYIPKLFVNGR